MLLPTQKSAVRALTWIGVGIALLMATLIALHVPHVNGPSYWPWPYVRVPIGRVLGIVAVAIGQCVLVLTAIRRPRRAWLWIVAVAVGTFLFRVAVSCLLAEPIGLSFATAVTRDPTATSFFAVADALRGTDWSLADYPSLMPQFPLHGVNKPPGPVLVCLAWLRLIPDSQSAATAVTLSSGALAALAVPLMAVFARSAGGNRRTSFHAAALMSVLPGGIAFFPSFDPAYTCLTLLMGICWLRAIRANAAPWSVAFGASLALAAFTAFHLLAFGSFLAIATIGVIVAAADWPRRAMTIAKLAMLAILTFIAIYGVVWLVTGFDIVSTFRVATREQQSLMERFGHDLRPYPRTILWDWADFALGAGYLPPILGAGWLVVRSHRRNQLWWSGIGAAITLLVLGLFGLLPGETARVWNFCYPLVVLPAAAWLHLGSRREQRLAYAALAVVGVVELVSLSFVMLGAQTITR